METCDHCTAAATRWVRDGDTIVLVCDEHGAQYGARAWRDLDKSGRHDLAAARTAIGLKKLLDGS